MLDELQWFTEMCGPPCPGERVLLRGKTVFSSPDEPHGTLARMVAWDRAFRLAAPILVVLGAVLAAAALL